MESFLRIQRFWKDSDGIPKILTQGEDSMDHRENSLKILGDYERFRKFWKDSDRDILVITRASQTNQNRENQNPKSYHCIATNTVDLMEDLSWMIPTDSSSRQPCDVLNPLQVAYLTSHIQFNRYRRAIISPSLCETMAYLKK